MIQANMEMLMIEKMPGQSSEPASPGKMFRSQGIEGSMKGFGVFLSKNIGMFIATFEPLRRRILAASVLECCKIIYIMIDTPYAKNNAHGKRTCGLMIWSGRKRD